MSHTSKPAIDFNSASEKELIQVLQVSPRLARRIISMRPFKSFDQLDQIWGLDPQTLQKIHEKFTLPAVEAAQDSALTFSGEPREAESSLAAGTSVREDLPAAIAASAEPLPEMESRPKSPSSWKTNLVFILILLVGAVFRFSGLNWDDSLHQHPDERYMTMVAESIRGVESIAAYFDTATSTLNPLNHGSYTYGMFPLFITRMVAQWVKMTSYDSITLVGRFLSGLFDLAAVWALYILAKRLYNQKVALLAAALAAVAVLPIQLSHFFTVDSFSTVFVVVSFYFLLSAIPLDLKNTHVNADNYKYFVFFGLSVGLAGACKVNTLPVLAMVFLSGAIYLFQIRKQPRFLASLGTILLGLFFSVLSAFLAFRVFQPYAFAGPSFSDLAINKRWYEVIKEVTNQVAGNSEWPPNHHWTNRPVQYAWVNMVLWGMGIPLGLAAWFGWGWAGVQIWKGNWRKHLFPFVWVLVYFIWQNAQFWRYMRYFIPIYPFLILFAAWAVVEFSSKFEGKWKRIKEIGRNLSLQRAEIKANWKGLLGVGLLTVVLLCTFTYAFAFSRIYTRDHSRVQASHWILENIQGPLNLKLDTEEGAQSIPIPVYNNHTIVLGQPAILDIKIKENGSTNQITAPNIKQIGAGFYFSISSDDLGEVRLTEWRLAIANETDQETFTVNFGDITLEAGETYYLNYQMSNNNRVSFSETRLKNEIEEDPKLEINLAFDGQEPGVLKGAIQFSPTQTMRINRFEINHFQQESMPSSALVRVSLLQNRDEQNPLAVSEKAIAFPASGATVDADFSFARVELNKENAYQIKYELIEGNVIQFLAEDYALETSWDDSLPLSVDNIDALGGIYSPLSLELYEGDTEVKREQMIAILEKTEYLVIPSNRSYDAMPRLELRYPLTLRYYQLLFGCDCSGDEMEKRAYGLEAPYASPLGFDLVATFTSNPNLGAIQLNDQNADESFTVYDHPKVLIFKKSADFSIEKVKAELYKVDLDQVIFQVPIDYTKAPTAMKLPADRLAAQTSGGTWSDMFDRLSLINQNQVFATLLWYLLLLLVGWCAFPLCFQVFSGLPDRGYSLTRMAGLLLLTWILWMLGSLKIASFTRWTILISLLLFAAVNVWIFYRNRQVMLSFIREHSKHLILVEFIFILLFLFFLSVRSGNPDLWHPWLGGEKPMDFAFFNGVLKSVYFPPENPWFSEHYINYYYYGYVVAAIPTKLLGVMPAIAFNLILPSWFAMVGIGVFGVTANIYYGFMKKQALPGAHEEDQPRRTRPAWLERIFPQSGLMVLAGVFALAAVLFFGNFYEIKLLWKNLPEVSNGILDAGGIGNKLEAVISGAGRVISGEAELPGDNGQWYFAASRPILHDEADTPIAEFPYFSFLYADLHPHLLTMPFYALALAWFLNIIFDPFLFKKWWLQILTIFLGALWIGSFRALHTWDFPTFIGLGVLLIGWMVIRARDISVRQKLHSIVIYCLLFVGLAMLCYAPFTHWFKTEYIGVELWKGLRTPLKDYFVVFGLSLFVMFTFLVLELKADYQKVHELWFEKRTVKTLIPVSVLLLVLIGMYLLWKFDYQVLAFGLPLLLLWAYIIFFKKDVSEFHRWIWVLFAIGYGITYVVEVVVLKGDVGRSNMVFRMYLEAWFILGIALSVAAIEAVKRLKSWNRAGRVGWIVVLQVLVLLALVYPLIATGKKIDDRWPNVINPPVTLDGSLFMLGNKVYDPDQSAALYSDDGRDIDLSLDYAGIQYMQDNILDSPVIVEGNTTEYRWGSRYAIHTGLPSVIGWSWHTRQHNSLLEGSIVENRIQDVVDFYNTTDLGQAGEFLEKYNVSYIIVSGLERVYYSAEGLAKFEEMAARGEIKVVFGSGNADSATIYEVIR
jgi:YYY domain-containing protein